MRELHARCSCVWLLAVLVSWNAPRAMSFLQCRRFRLAACSQRLHVHVEVVSTEWIFPKKKYNTVPTAVNLVTIHRKSHSNRVSSLFSIDFLERDVRDVYTMMMRSLDFRQMTFIFLWMRHYIFSHPVEIFSDDRTGGWESERWEIAKKRNRFRVFSHCSTHAYFFVRQNSVKQFKIFIFSGTHNAIAIAYVRVNF